MTDKENLQQKNRRTLVLLSGLVIGMFAFGFALVPLYNLICQVAGIQSVAVRSAAEPLVAPDTVIESGDTERLLTVKLDASVHPSLPWKIDLKQGSKLEVKTGKVYEVVFTALNRSNDPVSAQAIPSVTPWQANPYFNKLECFCFNQQTLAGGEQSEMPLRFVISPKLPKGINSITLSYSVMKIENAPLAQLSQ
ncbi:cytochrome c oxidase assembly protein [Motiliproteus sp. MSK22-1]|uniref:cytochrome c oxidase assembly protein n=1 Tax=Motiliproteus sp. MSK22-1 TaxID=1897630 RepID=UPI000977BB89|nr:cytochrome c oxidase assembly protein [Motiliproteus sp. MSK22-1]OMH30289.1 hypothetical protein BGP75_18025 [Motiliproteus sp. MSK22-1]